jgi:hypothetical protein
MTPTSVGLVLVEGHDGDGVTVERDAVEIDCGEDATAAILCSEALAASRGLRLKSIGVTWSEDVDAEASMLMKTLSESGFENIVPVALPEATEALARGIADALGYRTTAVCAIEPDTVITLIVHNMDHSDGAVHTAFNHTIDSDESLISWLSTVFTRADWQPQALAVVGSAGDFGEVCGRLQEALSVPVFSPAEAELALARGAALASATTAEFFLPDPYHFGDVLGSGYRGDDRDARPARHRRKGGRRRRSRDTAAVPLAMLLTGSVTFVASVSMAVSMQLMPDRHVRTIPTTATVQAEQIPAPVPTVAPVIPSAVPTESEPESVTAPTEQPEVQVPESPVIDAAPVVSPDAEPAPEGQEPAQTVQQGDTTDVPAAPPAAGDEPVVTPPPADETAPTAP